LRSAFEETRANPSADKNPGDDTAHERFQAIGEAYQILSNVDLRKQYDKYGKDNALPAEGFADPSEFFGTIFGGDAFVDLIGEISIMKDLTKTMDITMQEQDHEEEEFPGQAAAVEESIAMEKARAAAAHLAKNLPNLLSQRPRPTTLLPSTLRPLRAARQPREPRRQRDPASR
jgi:curved DNA-binding protein CbpA